MAKCKTKAIQGDLGIFTHIRSRIFRLIQAYPDTIRQILKPVLSWYIQNSDMFRILTYSKREAYSEFWHIQNWSHTQNLVKHL